MNCVKIDVILLNVLLTKVEMIGGFARTVRL